jgi:hypothetical protein
VHYLDTAGVSRTLAASAYTVKAPAGPRAARGRILLAYNTLWPLTLDQPGAVTIRFICGYATLDAVPDLLKVAMKEDLATLFEQRESLVIGAPVASLPGGPDAIYRSFKSWPGQVFASYSE